MTLTDLSFKLFLSTYSLSILIRDNCFCLRLSGVVIIHLRSLVFCTGTKVSSLMWPTRIGRRAKILSPSLNLLSLVFLLYLCSILP